MTTTTDLQTRAAPLRASTWNKDEWTFDLVLSAGAPVQRSGFVEVLDLDGASWPDTIPLLDSHRQGSLDDNLGDITNIRREGSEIIGTARLSKHSERAKRIAAELSDGRTFGASIGYRVETWAETKPAGKRTLTAKTWRIMEASLVSVPADPSSRIRSKPLENNENITTPPAATMTRAEVNTHIRAVAKAAGLDQAWIDGMIDADATVEQANAAALEALKARSSATGTIQTITIGTDHTDPASIRSAMADALAHRLAPGTVKLEGRAAEYRGHRVLDMVGDLATARGERINLRDQDALLQRAVGAFSTSDFPLLLADATNKALLSQYQVAAPTYRKWAARKPFADFKDHSFLRVGDFPTFKEINEGGEVRYGAISENAEKVRAKEFGTGIAIGRRALINDDLSALSDFSSMIATQAAAFENQQAYALLGANPKLSDGVDLFHTASHGNLASSPSTIDGTNVSLAVAQLRAQKSLDGLPLNLQPAFLVCGPAKEVAARQLLAAITPTKASEVNVWSGFAELVVDANISGNEWYVFTAPGAAPTIVYGYVGGNDGPQVRVERDFDTQAVKIAASLDFAVGAIDYRGAVKNAGA